MSRTLPVKYRLVILAVSLLLYVIALSLPCLLFNIVPRPGQEANAPTGALNAYGYPDNLYEMKGIELTIAGIFGLIFLQLPAVGWLANPAYWLGCFFLARQQYQIAAITALTAVVVGFTGTVSAFWFRLPSGSSSVTELALNQLLPGFWLWLAAPGLVALISLFRLL